MAKVVKPNREIVVNEILAEIEFFGISYKSCLAMNAEKWQLAQRTFDRYWAEALRRYQEAAERKKTALEGVRIEAEKESLKKAILTRFERMEILSQIAKGEILVDKPMVCDGVIEERPVAPDWQSRKAAIAELNKMDGEYAPIRKDITTEDKSPKKIIVKVKRREDN